MKARTIRRFALLPGAWLLAGAAWAQDCDRACLENLVDSYLDAVIANDPASLPLADHVRFTENGQVLRLGDGLWNSLKAKGDYRIIVADVEAGQVGFLGTIAEDDRQPEGSVPALMGLRLRLQGGEITQIEHMLVRDTAAAERVNAAMVNPLWTQEVPEAARMSRAELLRVANLYFSGMQKNDGRGEYPFAEGCNRFENGTLTTNRPVPEGEARADPATSSSYSAQWSCLEQYESGLLFFVNRIRDRRFVAVDPERGAVFAFAFFDHSGGEHRRGVLPSGREVFAGPAQPWTWYITELFKIEDGLIQHIDAILTQVPYGMLSGWSTWEEGMSDALQDVTFEDAVP